jgi:hypothetical protein
MTRFAPLLGVLLMAAGPLAQRRPPVPQNPDLVELDVVVLDKSRSRYVDSLTRTFKSRKTDGRLRSRRLPPSRQAVRCVPTMRASWP